MELGALCRRRGVNRIGWLADWVNRIGWLADWVNRIGYLALRVLTSIVGLLCVWVFDSIICLAPRCRTKLLTFRVYTIMHVVLCRILSISGLWVILCVVYNWILLMNRR